VSVGPRYLLDTNILSELIRRPQGVVARKIASVGEPAICTSLIVACELRFGARKKASPRLSERVDTVLSAVEVLPLHAPIDRIYADIRQRLAATGILIGPNDMLIAAHALALEATLVTANVGEFSRVSGLPLENWLQ
jgi:tRNA(fMet)-specific endonuclease VapC